MHISSNQDDDFESFLVLDDELPNKNSWKQSQPTTALTGCTDTKSQSCLYQMLSCNAQIDLGLGEGIAYLGNGKWSKYAYLLFFISQWNVHNLSLSCTGIKIMEIHHIQFSQLRILDLSGNQLASIEGLGYLNAPSINKILLNNNHIVSISALKRLFTNTELIELNLSLNYIQDLQNLHQINFSVDMVGMDLQQCSQTDYFDERNLFKSRATKMKYIRLSGRFLCNQMIRLLTQGGIR